jgi:hypothetical protein
LEKKSVRRLPKAVSGNPLHTCACQRSRRRCFVSSSSEPGAAWLPSASPPMTLNVNVHT